MFRRRRGGGRARWHHRAVLKFLRSLLAPTTAAVTAASPRTAMSAPTSLAAPGVDDFDVAAHLVDANGLPVLDWHAARQWVDAIGDAPAQAIAWTACELAWLGHLAAALGPDYRIVEDEHVAVLSNLEPKLAEATRAFVARTRQRVVRVLDGIADAPATGKEILLVFGDDDIYYRYVAHYYPEAGEFAGSGGMFIDHGCGHFATVKADLRAIEPVIAHELTHACLIHLPMPAWLNEGLAVNTEQRLCPPPADTFGHRASPQQMHGRHRAFWGPAEIQEFWSGKSFLRTDEGNELSYDLARIIVAQFANDWDRFRAFVRAADLADAGAAAARAHLGADLGAVAAALLERAASDEWAPQPRLWGAAPERGAFQRAVAYDRVAPDPTPPRCRNSYSVT